MSNRRIHSRQRRWFAGFCGVENKIQWVKPALIAVGLVLVFASLLESVQFLNRWVDYAWFGVDTVTYYPFNLFSKTLFSDINAVAVFCVGSCGMQYVSAHNCWCLWAFDVWVKENPRNLSGFLPSLGKQENNNRKYQKQAKREEQPQIPQAGCEDYTANYRSQLLTHIHHCSSRSPSKPPPKCKEPNHRLKAKWKKARFKSRAIPNR